MKDLRQNYTLGSLLEENLPSSPFDLFQAWFEEAMSSDKILEPNAMVLSTCADNKVDSRIVLLKDLREKQFVFYSNYTSHKGTQLEKNPHCNLLFPWVELQRQIIIRGEAAKVSESESIEYFASRPVSSQLGAWVSEQSKPVSSRMDLESRLEKLTTFYSTNKLTKPENWGGYEVTPLQIEFWQGRENRLHDRIVYSYENNEWKISRLQP
ncbi:pyridoxamine 5'-phosphate oxidase [Bacteroidia bacterium]|nr:pyridoxamine 5'-phosphate oxidase [Bacteroidia bacterium]